MIIRATAITLPLRDDSVDLVVTSPPYFALRSYQDGGGHYAGQIGDEAGPGDYVDALVTVTAELVRVLKRSGSLFVNLGDKYAGSGGNNQSGLGDARLTKATVEATTVVTGVRDGPRRYNQNRGGVAKKSLMGLPWRYALRCIDELGLILRAEIIWAKPNGMPESVDDRVRRSHETWFHLVRSGDYFADLTGFVDKYVGDRTPSRLTKTPGGGKHEQRAPWAPVPHRASRPGSVWTIPTEPLALPEAVRDHFGFPDHYAAFPTEWPRRLILGWCPPDGVVLDPFGGTGTTEMVARALGRRAVTVDLSADYCRLARWRIHRSGHAAKAQNRTWADRQGTLL